MKKFYLFVVLLACFITNASAQLRKDKKEVAAAVDPFSKGNWNFSNISNLGYTNFKSQVNGDPKSFSFRADPVYFIANGLGIGLDARASSSSNTAFNKTIYRYWQTSLVLMYGRKVSDNIAVYLKLLAGPGGSHNKFDISTYGTNPQILDAKYMNYRGMIGAPIKLSNDGMVFFTPYISYEYGTTKLKNNIQDLEDRTFSAGFKLETFLNKNAKSMPADLSSTVYKKGAQFIEFATGGGFSSNSHTQNFNNGTFTPDVKTKSTSLGLGYNYYFLDNFAAGLFINTSSRKETSPSVDKHSSFSIQPVVTAQAPLEGAGKNLFLAVGYGFGKINDGGLKKNVSDFTAKLGYNIFMTRSICLTPKIGYENINAKYTGSSGIPYKNSGLVAELGIRTWVKLF